MPKFTQAKLKKKLLNRLKSARIRKAQYSCKYCRVSNLLDQHNWMSLRAHKSQIKLAALSNNLDPSLLAALLITESDGRIFAARFEPDFYRRYIKPRDKEFLKGHWPKWSNDPDGNHKERLDRSTSWGLGQIMGQTAREHGFSGNYLCHLCDPITNIMFTAEILANFFAKASKNNFEDVTRQALLYYNGGADTKYPDRVLKNLEKGQRVIE